MSVMEMSHRSQSFQEIIDTAEADLRELMGIPDNYKVLFLQGGESQQFAMVPMNLMKNKVADYIVTGQWAKKAAAEAKKYGKLEHIYGAENGTGGVLEEHFLALENVPEEKLELLLQTPGTAIGTSRDPIWQEDYEKMADILVKREIKYVLFNGGNGTMDTCGKLHKTCQARNLDIRVMGIPKTTDNDIAVTDHSPGFGSAARYIAACTEELCADVRSCQFM